MILELFCGTKSISKVFMAAGYETFTVDNDIYHNPDLCIDILKLEIDMLPADIDFIWASPPCTTFSVMSNFNYWRTPHYPKNSFAAVNMAYVLKTIEIINNIKPRFWFIENPVGLLRKFEFMKNLPRKTLNYCQYGTTYMKPTDIWTNRVEWIPRKRCKNGDNCHLEARRGMKMPGTVQGLRSTSGWSKEDRIMRSIIPIELCEEILSVYQNKLIIKQTKLKF